RREDRARTDAEFVLPNSFGLSSSCTNRRTRRIARGGDRCARENYNRAALSLHIGATRAAITTRGGAMDTQNKQPLPKPEGMTGMATGPKPAVGTSPGAMPPRPASMTPRPAAPSATPAAKPAAAPAKPAAKKPAKKTAAKKKGGKKK